MNDLHKIPFDKNSKLVPFSITNMYCNTPTKDLNRNYWFNVQSEQHQWRIKTWNKKVIPSSN